MITINCVGTSDNAKLPHKAHPGDAAFDIFCDHDVIVGARATLVSTGICMEIPEGYFGKIEARSGHSRNNGLRIVGVMLHGGEIRLGGIIDAPYRGPIGVILAVLPGMANKPFKVGDAVAQMLLLPAIPAVCRWAPDGTLNPSDRGQGGFGHTDQKRDSLGYAPQWGAWKAANLGTRVPIEDRFNEAFDKLDAELSKRIEVIQYPVPGYTQEDYDYAIEATGSPKPGEEDPWADVMMTEQQQQKPRLAILEYQEGEPIGWARRAADKVVWAGDDAEATENMRRAVAIVISDEYLKKLRDDFLRHLEELAMVNPTSKSFDLKTPDGKAFRVSSVEIPPLKPEDIPWHQKSGTRMPEKGTGSPVEEPETDDTAEHAVIPEKPSEGQLEPKKIRPRKYKSP
jgi:dUTP pyrophosphatase